MCCPTAVTEPYGLWSAIQGPLSLSLSLSLACYLASLEAKPEHPGERSTKKLMGVSGRQDVSSSSSPGCSQNRQIQEVHGPEHVWMNTASQGRRKKLTKPSAVERKSQLQHHHHIPTCQIDRTDSSASKKINLHTHHQPVSTMAANQQITSQETGAHSKKLKEKN